MSRTSADCPNWTNSDAATSLAKVMGPETTLARYPSAPDLSVVFVAKVIVDGWPTVQVALFD